MFRWLFEETRQILSVTTLDTLTDWMGAAALVIGAPWALITFRRNNRIKAAELLLRLEDECHRCLPTLLKLEYLSDYNSNYKPALAAALKAGARFTPVQSTAINDVERVLRHLHACYHVRRLGVDAGALDRTYSYYLRLCVSDDRSELRDYLRRYWPNVFFWAQRVGHPWPRRLTIHAQQLRPRLRVWWDATQIR